MEAELLNKVLENQQMIFVFLGFTSIFTFAGFLALVYLVNSKLHNESSTKKEIHSPR